MVSHLYIIFLYDLKWLTSLFRWFQVLPSRLSVLAFVANLWPAWATMNITTTFFSLWQFFTILIILQKLLCATKNWLDGKNKGQRIQLSWPSKAWFAMWKTNWPKPIIAVQSHRFECANLWLLTTILACKKPFWNICFGFWNITIYI